MRVEAKDRSGSVGTATTGNTQKEGSGGEITRGQGKYQEASQGSQTVGLSKPAQFVVGTRLRGD